MERPDLKQLAQEWKEQSKPIITQALVNGASQMSKNMNNAAKEANQSPKILFGIIRNTVTNGLLSTSQDIMANSLDIIRKDRNKGFQQEKQKQEEV
ncbi:hypothetical protein F9U64_09680 [Gracilibacillus oryzae]|uniref:Uncharacterized protein n=1 Tax=Gracilibacillus oryzae TaxID=1672701 RepID=A0A7C8GU17_9BACI|nr:hypothetical protein [Gracilibacillus oryzae]KAB8136769.1 hypothetical protein F9U64_09680 [Gracilibacillus oryzae]